MTTTDQLAAPNADRDTRPRPGRALGWAFTMTFADRAVWRRIIAMAVGIGVCSLALLGLASINPTVARISANAVALTPTAISSAPSTFSFRNINLDIGGDTVTGVLLAGDAQSPPPPGAATFPRIGEIYASPRLAALLESPSGGDARTLLPGRLVGVLPSDRLRGPDDLFFYRGAEATSMMSPAPGWGNGADYRHVDPELWILLATGSLLLMIPLVMFVALAARLGGPRRERRNGVLALLGASRGRIRLLGAVESGTAGLAGVGLGIGALLLLRLFTDRMHYDGVGLRPGDLGPTTGGWWWVSLGVVIVCTVTGSMVGLRPADATRPQGSIPPSRRHFRWWWRLVLALTTTGVMCWALSLSGSVEWESQSTQVRVLLPCVLVVLTMLTLAAASTPLIALVCRLWRPSSTTGQLARGRILTDGALATRSAAALATVLAGALTLMPLLGTVSAAHGASTITYGSLEGTVAEISAVESTAERSNGPEFIGISAVFGSGVERSSAGPQLSVVTCPIVRRVDPGVACRDGDVFQIPRADPINYPLPRPPYRITLLQSTFKPTQGAPTRVNWSPSAATRTLTAEQDPTTVDPLLSNVFGSDFLLTPAAAVRAFPALATDRLTLTVTMQIRAGNETRQRFAMAALGERAFDSMRWVSSDDEVDPFLPWIISGLVGVALLVLLISALAQMLTTLEQIRERKRPYAMGRAAGIPTALLSQSMGLSLIVPILVTMVAAVGAGLLLNLVMGRLLQVRDSTVPWPVVGIGVVAAVLAAALVALGASWSLQRSTRPAAMRTE